CFYVLTAHGQFRNLLSTDTATSTLYTLSLHDALPILHASWMPALGPMNCSESFAKKHCTTGLSPSGIASYFMSATSKPLTGTCLDRKSTRLNSSHVSISYAVFCLKKKSRLVFERIRGA